MSKTPVPFSLHVADEDIADLRARLARTRFPDQAPGDAWQFGTDVAYLRNLVEYWQTGFDWRAQEAALNAFPQFKVGLHGIDLHFLHVPGNGPAPMPLLLLHGWPGSVFEFLEIIPRLTDPARFGGDPRDAFTVVVPSLPGYGLSFSPNQPRFDVPAMADCLFDLMHERPGLRALRRAGRRLGRGHCEPARRCTRARADRHPRQPAVGGEPRSRRLSESDRRRAPLPRRTRTLDAGGGRLRIDSGIAAAIARCRPHGFAGGPRCVDRRKIPGMVGLRGRYRAGDQPGSDACRYRAVLVHGVDQRVVLAVLRPLARRGHPAAGRHDLRRRPLTRRSRARSSGRRARPPSACSPTFADGPSCQEAAISRRSNSRRCLLRTCRRFLDRCARPIGAQKADLNPPTVISVKNHL